MSKFILALLVSLALATAVSADHYTAPDSNYDGYTTRGGGGSQNGYYGGFQ